MQDNSEKHYFLKMPLPLKETILLQNLCRLSSSLNYGGKNLEHATLKIGIHNAQTHLPLTLYQEISIHPDQTIFPWSIWLNRKIMRSLQYSAVSEEFTNYSNNPNAVSAASVSGYTEGNVSGANAIRNHFIEPNHKQVTKETDANF